MAVSRFNWQVVNNLTVSQTCSNESNIFFFCLTGRLNTRINFIKTSQETTQLYPFEKNIIDVSELYWLF